MKTPVQVKKFTESCRELSFYLLSLSLSWAIFSPEPWMYNLDDMWKYDRQFTVPLDFKALYVFECSWCGTPGRKLLLAQTASVAARVPPCSAARACSHHRTPLTHYPGGAAQCLERHYAATVVYAWDGPLQAVGAYEPPRKRYDTRCAVSPCALNLL
jgi:hypothetical protein